jgi:FKBP-type peptidyl-prolyl cis-trans isomerase 2
MAPGDRKQFSLRQREPCGSVNRGLVRKIRRDQIPDHIVLYVGKRLSRVPGSAGRPRRVTIVEIRPDAIVVEGPHPLAGKLIELEVSLLSLDSSSNANRSKQQFDMGGEG